MAANVGCQGAPVVTVVMHPQRKVNMRTLYEFQRSQGGRAASCAIAVPMMMISSIFMVISGTVLLTVGSASYSDDYDYNYAEWPLTVGIVVISVGVTFKLVSVCLILKASKKYKMYQQHIRNNQAPINGSYPNQPVAFPNTHSGQANAYPTQPNAYPTQPNAYPTQPNAYPYHPNANPGQTTASYPPTPFFDPAAGPSYQPPPPPYSETATGWPAVSYPPPVEGHPPAGALPVKQPSLQDPEPHSGEIQQPSAPKNEF